MNERTSAFFQAFAELAEPFKWGFGGVAVVLFLLLAASLLLELLSSLQAGDFHLAKEALQGLLVLFLLLLLAWLFSSLAMDSFFHALLLMVLPTHKIGYAPEGLIEVEGELTGGEKAPSLGFLEWRLQKLVSRGRRNTWVTEVRRQEISPVVFDGTGRINLVGGLIHPREKEVYVRSKEDGLALIEELLKGRPLEEVVRKGEAKGPTGWRVILSWLPAGTPVHCLGIKSGDSLRGMGFVGKEADFVRDRFFTSGLFALLSAGAVFLASGVGG